VTNDLSYKYVSRVFVQIAYPIIVKHNIRYNQGGQLLNFDY